MSCGAYTYMRFVRPLGWSHQGIHVCHWIRVRGDLRPCLRNVVVIVRDASHGAVLPGQACEETTLHCMHTFVDRCRARAAAARVGGVGLTQAGRHGNQLQPE